MKKLKIAVFVLVALFFILHIVVEYIIIIENGGVLTHQAWILKQYEMLTQYVAIPISLVYLYKRLK
jgi:hypothetical protein